MAIHLTPEDIDEQVQGVMARPYVNKDYLSLFGKIFKAQCEIENVLSAEDIYSSVSKSEPNECLESGFPIIKLKKLRLNEIKLLELLREIASISAEYATGGNSAAMQLLKAKESGQIELNELIPKTLSNDSEYINFTCNKIGIDEEDIKVVVQLLIAPFLRIYAQQLKLQLDIDLVRTNRCPICGTAPAMAKLRLLDGKRILECSLCYTQWVFKRIGCPFCGNEDQATLGFFFTNEVDEYRIDTCDKCNRYIKTVDERRKADNRLRASLPVEDVATLYLDELAEQQGFKSIKSS